MLNLRASVEHNGNDGSIEVGGKDGRLGGGQGNKAIKLALSGCHDTTLAAVLASLGAFQGEPWPPYTSHIALELFRKGSIEKVEMGAESKLEEGENFPSHSICVRIVQTV